jgi:hypothetical protein
MYVIFPLPIGFSPLLSYRRFYQNAESGLVELRVYRDYSNEKENPRIDGRYLCEFKSSLCIRIIVQGNLIE